MSTEVTKALARIEADTALIRRLVSAPAPQQPAKAPKKGNKAVVPEIAASYTPDEATVAHQQIESAYQAQLIDYDKKRGLKMRVTKATVGWTPDKKKAA